MKMTKKIAATLTALLMTSALIFTGCKDPETPDPNTDPKTDPVTYGLSFNEDTSALSVKVDEEITLTVKEVTGTYKVDTDNLPSSVEVTPVEENGKLASLTIKGVSEATAAEITLYPAEDDSGESDVKISVNVIDPVFTFTLTLDETLAASANSIAVTYKSSEHTTTESAVVSYTPGATSATVSFVKEYADTYYYFNNITVKVYDSSEGEIASALSDDYFDYTDATFAGLSVTASSADATMTLTIELTNMDAAAKVKVVTVNSNDESDVSEELTADVTSGKAVFTISKHGAWEKIKSVKVLDSDDAEITGYAVSGNDWWQWTDNTSVTVKYVLDTSTWTQIGDSVEYTGTGKLIEILSKTDLTGISSYTTIKIEIAVSIWAGSDWATLSADDNWTTKIENISGTDAGYTVTLTKTDNEAFLTSAESNGIYLGTSSGQVSTITIYYQ